VEYFGQEFEPTNCGACDLCLEGVETEPEAVVIAQKILSCVARVKEGFGVGHVTDVLVGSQNAKVKKYGHDRLSTHGLLREFGEGFLERIAHYCRQNGVALDNTAGPPPAAAPVPREGPSLNARAAFPLFQRGAPIAEVMQQLGRARSTVVEYLCEFIRAERP